MNIERKQYESALADIGRANQLLPLAANLHNTRGRVLRYLRGFEESVEAYSTAIKLQPEFATAFGNRVELYQELEDYARSRAG